MLHANTIFMKLIWNNVNFRYIQNINRILKIHNGKGIQNSKGSFTYWQSTLKYKMRGQRSLTPPQGYQEEIRAGSMMFWQVQKLHCLQGPQSTADTLLPLHETHINVFQKYLATSVDLRHAPSSLYFRCHWARGRVLLLQHEVWYVQTYWHHRLPWRQTYCRSWTLNTLSPLLHK